jgi:hypothetical protein
MFYAILAYHVEDTVQSWTPDEDAALMKDLLEVNTRLTREGKLGPAARLGATAEAVTLRGPADGMVIDGPFAETKEQLLGFYILDCENLEDALGAARELGEANPGGAYEVRPLLLYAPGVLSPEKLAAAG